MSRIKHPAAYMFRTLTVRNVRLTRKSKISRLTRLRLLHYRRPGYMFQTLKVRNVRLTRKSKISRLTHLRLLHYPKTCGMSCAASIEIEDVSHKAPCRLRVPNSYGTECPSYEIDFPLNSALGFALSEDLRYGMCVLRASLRYPA